MSLPILNPYLAEFSYPKNPENMRPHSSNSRHNTNPCSHISHKNDTSSTDTSSLPYSWEVIPPSPVHWHSLSFTTQFATFIDANPQ